AGTFANVRIKGPPAGNRFEWSFGFDIRLSGSRLDDGECQIHSTRIGGAFASPARDRADAFAEPELGLQPDRRQTGASSYSATAARPDSFRRRAARIVADRPPARREALQLRRHALRRAILGPAVRRRIRADLPWAVTDFGLACGSFSLYRAILRC